MQILTSLKSKIRQEPDLFVFLLVWFIINIIQATFTGIFHDEAYYWMYSKNLAWGYFDHPPMIALLIKIGYWIIPSVLGVRLFTVIFSTISMYFIYQLIDHENKSVKWLIYIATSIILVHSHVCGFLAIPDSPLIFFTVLFFYFYKKFLNEESYRYAIILGFIIALMLYSKYHAVLVLFFTILSNIKLLTRPKFWLIVLLSVFLFLPHIIWQVNNEFPTIQYHLYDRSSAYTIKHTINFLYSQILVAGPFIGVILLYFGFKRQPKNLFEKSLKFTLVGFYVFFFLSSFKGHTEAHWIAIAIIPLIILSSNEILDRENVLKWCKIIFYPTIVLFIAARLYYMVDYWPGKSYNVEMHHWDEWAEDIEAKAGKLPVVFMNSYQRASKYEFYTGNEAVSLNNIFYRKNQFDIWNQIDELQGKDVFIVYPMYHYPLDTLITRTHKKYMAGKVNNFRAYNKIHITVLSEDMEGVAGDTILVPVEIKNYSPIRTDFYSNPELESHVAYSFFQKNKIQFRPQVIKNLILKNLEPNEMYKDTLEIAIPKKLSGNYEMMFSIKSGWLSPCINSRYTPINIKPSSESIQ